MTAGKPTRLRLTPDRAVIHADGEDLSFITVETVDADGRLEPQADQEVQFAINGPGVIAAVGNGDAQDPASYQGDRRKLFQGRALVVVRTSKLSGSVSLTAKATGLNGGSATIQTQAVEPRPEL